MIGTGCNLHRTLAIPSIPVIALSNTYTSRSQAHVASASTYEGNDKPGRQKMTMHIALKKYGQVLCFKHSKCTLVVKNVSLC